MVAIIFINEQASFQQVSYMNYSENSIQKFNKDNRKIGKLRINKVPLTMAYKDVYIKNHIRQTQAQR